MRTIALVPGRSGAAFWAAALPRHLAAWRETGSPTSLTTVRRLVQALGAAEERALLAGVAADPEVPADVQAAARWWLGLAGPIRASAAG